MSPVAWPLEELGRAEDRQGQLEAAAGGADGRVVADLGLDRHDVGQGLVSVKVQGLIPFPFTYEVIWM